MSIRSASHETYSTESPLLVAYMLFPKTQNFAVLALFDRLVPTKQSRALSSIIDTRSSKLEEEYAGARRWAATLNKETLPRGLARVRFDRSSGKGGQHVNT